MMLNELQEQQESMLPPTDARLRPDIRKLEGGDIGTLFIATCLEIAQDAETPPRNTKTELLSLTHFLARPD